MNEKSTEKKPDVKNVELKRELGLFSAVNLVINITIGAGIFVSPAIVYRFTGSVALCLIMWVVAGVMSLIGALVYAELASLVPRSGGAYSYIQKAFGPLHAFWGPLPSFCNAFLDVFIIMPCGAAIYLLTFSEYFLEFLLNFVCMETDNLMWAKKLIAVGLICVITYLNARSVKVFLTVQNFFTVTKVLICLVIIGGGIYHMCSGNIESLQTGFEGSTPSAGNLSLAFVYGMFAFGGWHAVNAVTDEVKKPEVNILRSILIAQPFVAVVYLLMNVSYMSVLTFDEMTSGETVAVAFSDQIYSWFSLIVPLGVAITIFGSTMAVQFAVTRLCHIAAQFGHMPELLSYVHVEYLTPSPAVLLQGILSLILILVGEITSLIQFASVISWLLHALCMISVMILRKTMPDTPRLVKVPIVLPILFLIISLFVCVVTVVVDLSVKYIVALGLIILSIAIYYFLVYKKYCEQWTGKITNSLQAVLLVAPMDEK